MVTKPERIKIRQTRSLSAVAGYTDDGRVWVRAEDESGQEVEISLSPGQASTLAGHLALSVGDALRSAVR